MADLIIDPGAVYVRVPGLAPYCHASPRVGSPTVCTRPEEHDGRHASIGIDGSVYDVWGPDVLAANRVRARNRLALRRTFAIAVARGFDR